MNLPALFDGEGISPMAARLGMYLVFLGLALGVVIVFAQSMLRPSFRRMRRYFRHRQRQPDPRFPV